MALPLTARAFDPGTIQHLFDASQSLEPKSVLIQASVMTALSVRVWNFDVDFLSIILRS